MGETSRLSPVSRVSRVSRVLHPPDSLLQGRDVFGRSIVSRHSMCTELGVAVRTVPILNGVMRVPVNRVHGLMFVLPAHWTIRRLIAFEIIKRLFELRVAFESECSF